MNKSQSEILTEAAIEMIDTVADAVNDPKSITKTYTYTNKKGVKKTVKRKYEVKSTDAKNPEIKQRIIDVITKNKDELLKENPKHVVSKIQSLLKEQNLPGSYNFIKKQWLLITQPVNADN